MMAICRKHRHRYRAIHLQFKCKVKFFTGIFILQLLEFCIRKSKFPQYWQTWIKLIRLAE